jgi:hypothetical protein
MKVPWIGIIALIIGFLIWRSVRKTPLARWKAITLTIGLTYMIGTLIAFTSLRLGSTASDLGSSCNKVEFDRNIQLLESFTNANVAYDYELAASELMKFRSSLRKLDLPSIRSEQSALVDVTANYLSALNKYVASGNKDLSFYDQQIPFADAMEDFLVPFDTLCSKR